ncbi:MAG: hypothetical protein JWN99_1270 [Ilumatobacteraceae bacterium]|nr:hypothetical protein [Ilumatobacteraceae bacterium]
MIVFDIQAVQSRSHGERGIARYCLEVAHAIERIAPDHIDRYTVNPHRPIPASLEHLIRTGKVVRSDEVSRERLSLLHVGSPVELDLPIEQIVFGQPERLVVNLFDLIPLVFRDHYLRDPGTSLRYLTRIGVYNSADRVLADSQSAADDAIRLLGIPAERCRVVGAGASEAFRLPSGGVAEAAARVMLDLPAIRPGYIMLPSGIDWRKNIEGVLRGYSQLSAELRRRHQLVLVCRAAEDERRYLLELADGLGCADTFVMTGYVSDSLLVALNQAAYLVIFPSRYEGFGLPVLEARRCGAAVICGDNSSLREVLPDPRARFDAADDESIRVVLDRALNDSGFIDELRSMPVPPFTWERAAQLTIDAHEELLNSPRPASLMADIRPRIAYVTPLPPIESGVARYSYQLLTELARQARVRCFSDQDFAHAAVPAGVAISPMEDLASMQAAGEFDHVVIALGNNAIHASALQLSRRVPSVVHLHDVRLVNCYADESWPHVVERQYPGRFSASELAMLPAPWADLVQTKSIFLLADVASTTRRMLVHSKHAASLIELDVGHVALDVGPHAVPRRVVQRTVVDTGLVVSLGIVSTAKQSDKIVGAASVLQRRGSHLEFVLVGDGGEIVTDHPANLHVAGMVDDGEYTSFLGRATVAVQLRDHTNGESSGAVADCLGAGVPVIVSDVGSFAELPDAAVVKVRRDITAHELADTIESLVADPERRRAMSDAAIEYSQRHTFAAAARQLLDALATT